MSALDQSVQFLKGAGPRRKEQLDRLGIAIVRDLLRHYPRDYVDRSQLTQLADAKIGQHVTSLVEVVNVNVRPTHRGRQNFQAVLKDDSGRMEAVWFNRPYLKNYLRIGLKLMVSGEVAQYRNRQLRSPEYEIITDEDRGLLNTGRIVPIYPLTAGLTQRAVRALVRAALDLGGPDIEDPVPAAVVRDRGLPPLLEALAEIHFPSSWASLAKARTRLTYDGVFFHQLLVARRKRVAAQLPGIAFAATGALSREIARALPWKLTGAQQRVLVEIRDDMRRSKPMNRLLMGEVGSGKTLVALLAGCLAIEEGYQVALLAPTEILAEQHAASLRAFIGEHPVPVRLLTGQSRSAHRRHVLLCAKAGDPGFYVGTHALFQESVLFEKLGLVIVDEQHRFGVKQRAELKAKGVYPDVLVMTATPIPRTLAMTVYADLDHSMIDELPPGRGGVVTKVVRGPAREKVYAFVRKELERGHRAYVVVPLVAESEKIDLRAATEVAERLELHPAFRGFEIGLLHGRQRAAEKEATMSAFRDGRLHVLVTTTVVEVGVDVPEATVMLVEHPDRYGLSQLHQLRGRIGRGPARSYFVLLASQGLSSAAFKRLRVLESTTSGIRVAEADLELRGAGELFGTRQHGEAGSPWASFSKDQALIGWARDDAEQLVAVDPAFESPEGTRVFQELVARFGDRASFYHVA